MSRSIRLLVRVSGIGCLLSAASHIATLTDRSISNDVWGTLILAGFFVWGAALVAASPLNERIIQDPRRMWKILLECAPRWMRAFVICVWTYAAVNWVLATGTVGPISSGDPHFARVGSGVMLGFYATAMAILYSAGAGARAPRCPEGHVIRDERQICPICGNPPENPTPPFSGERE
jgi:hypothetical protein